MALRTLYAKAVCYAKRLWQDNFFDNLWHHKSLLVKKISSTPCFGDAILDG